MAEATVVGKVNLGKDAVWEGEVCEGFLEDDRAAFLLYSKHFPSKVGGKPAWLALSSLPRPEQLQCRACQHPMILVLQIYLPDSRHEYAFHRTMFVFACPRGACSGQPNSNVGLRVFRCCLPCVNAFYGASYRKDDETDSPNAGERNLLCGVCGCLADPSIVSRSDPALHYCHTSHRDLSEQHGSDQQAADALLFRERFVELEIAEEGGGEGEDQHGGDLDSSDSSDEDGELTMEEVREQLKLVQRLDPDAVVDMRECLSGHKQSGRDTAPRVNAESLSDLPAVETLNLTEDRACQDPGQRFMAYCQEEPDQVLRYARYGAPLYPAKKFKPGPANIRACKHCGEPRTFEFQILPQLLYFLKVDVLDGLSFDFATLLVYSCYCRPPAAYVEDQVFKQDYDDDLNFNPTRQIMNVLEELDKS